MISRVTGDMLKARGSRRQFGVFVLGGVVSAIVDVGLVALLLPRVHYYQIAVTVGFFAGLAVNFAYHARITFNSLVSLPVFCRYALVVASNYVITIFLVWFLYSALELPVLAGKLISLPVVAVIGFVLSRSWVFEARSGHSESSNR